MRQRYYNSEIKRFVNQDILTGSIGNSQSLNRYSYVQGNPVSYTDPFGLSPFNGLFSGTNLVHSLLGLVGWIPGPIGAVANGIDGVVYALVDKDYKNAVLSAGSAFTFGAGKIVAKVGKGSKTALRVQRVCNFAGSGINFAQSAEGTYQTASMMADKYIVQGQSFSGTTVLEFVLLAANVTGTYKSGTYAINDVVDGVRAVGRQYASWKEAKARSAGQSGSNAVPESLLQGDANTRVYVGIKDGKPDYVGIAYDIERRQSQHGERFDYLRELTTEPLTRRQARAIEQVMINSNPKFSNKINSISTKRDWYNDAVTWGDAWLKQHGYLK